MASSDRVANLQTWLNAHGAKLAIDGQAGPATRSAIIETFRNSAASAITIPELNMYADRLGVTVRQLQTVAQVESAGGGWDQAGLLKCLYERHYLWRRIKLAVPFLSDPTPGGYTIDADHDGINDSWEKLADAALRFGFNVAAECASFGKFQIMGAWWSKLNYSSVAEFIWTLSRGEAAHYDALCRYVEVNGLIAAMRAISDHPGDCTAFARGFNGAGQNGYDQRLADAFRGIK